MDAETLHFMQICSCTHKISIQEQRTRMKSLNHRPKAVSSWKANRAMSEVCVSIPALQAVASLGMAAAGSGEKASKIVFFPALFSMASHNTNRISCSSVCFPFLFSKRLQRPLTRNKVGFSDAGYLRTKTAYYQNRCHVTLLPEGLG